MICKSLPSSYSVRNVCVKIILTFVIGFGITCAIFATQSYRWYVFNHDIDNVETWDFLPANKTSIISIGLFRYQTSADDANASGPFATRGSLYDPPFVGSSYPWTFTAQICIIVGPLLAFFGWLMAVVGVNKHVTVFAMAVSMVAQFVGVITSMSLCDQFMACPWLIGALANVVAAISFLFGWLLSFYGLVASTKKRTQTESSSDDDEDHPSITDTNTSHDVQNIDLEEGYEASYGISAPLQVQDIQDIEKGDGSDTPNKVKNGSSITRRMSLGKLLRQRRGEMDMGDGDPSTTELPTIAVTTGTERTVEMGEDP